MRTLFYRGLDLCNFSFQLFWESHLLGVYARSLCAEYHTGVYTLCCWCHYRSYRRRREESRYQPLVFHPHLQVTKVTERVLCSLLSEPLQNMYRNTAIMVSNPDPHPHRWCCIRHSSPSFTILYTWFGKWLWHFIQTEVAKEMSRNHRAYPGFGHLNPVYSLFKKK